MYDTYSILLHTASFICRPSDYTVSEDAGIEPGTVATTALAVARSNALTTRLALIHWARSHPNGKLEQKMSILTSTEATEATRTSLGLRRSTASRLYPGWNSVSSRLDPGHLIINTTIFRLYTSVGDPESDPDPHVFGPPGSRPISQRYGSGSGSFPFLIKVIKVLSGLK
jgi:hypothetical protein